MVIFLFDNLSYILKIAAPFNNPLLNSQKDSTKRTTEDVEVEPKGIFFDKLKINLNYD